jgi:hypothetical protein
VLIAPYDADTLDLPSDHRPQSVEFDEEAWLSMRGRMLAIGVVLIAVSCSSAAPPVAKSSTPQTPLAQSPTPTPTPIHIPPIAEGIYESDVTQADALRFDLRTDLIDENTGHFKLTFRAGRWRLVSTSPRPYVNPVVGGIYYGNGHTMVLEWQFPASDTGKDTCRWRYDAKSKMLFLAILSANPDIGAQTDAVTALRGDRTIFQSHPWRKTG